MSALAKRLDVGGDVAEELDELAESEASGEVEGPPLHRARRGPSEVFSVRLPAAEAAQLREAADKEGMSPGALIRRLALSALGKESQVPDVPNLTHQQAEQLFRETLEAAAERAILKVTTVEQGLNLRRRMVHNTLRDRDRHLA